MISGNKGDMKLDLDITLIDPETLLEATRRELLRRQLTELVAVLSEKLAEAKLRIRLEKEK